MKAFRLLLGLFVCSIVSSAQQHFIRYDLAGENVRYYKIKKQGDTVAVSVLPLAKTKRVNLQLVNAASSYRHRIVYINREETPEAVVIPGIGGNPAQKLVSGLTPVDTDLFGINTITKSGGDEKSNDRFTETAQQKAAKLKFAQQYNEYALALSQWNKAMLFEQNCEVLWKELAELRYTLQSPATEIKKSAVEKTTSLFPGADTDPSVILLNNNPDNLKNAVKAVKSGYTALFTTYGSFDLLDISSRAADSLMSEAEKKMKAVTTGAAVGSTTAPDALLSRISTLFRQIKSDSYVRLAPLEISRKTIMAEIDFIPLVDTVTATAINLGSGDTLRRLVPIFKKEPLRFRNTYGFSFVSYAENRWHYFVRPDSVIAREPADQFQPVVVTYLHFYAPRDKGFRWGGTFGAGIPVGGDNAKLNIMLGLSTFLGKNDPVCISLGVTGTQIKKMSGWKTGDKVGFSQLTANDYNTVYRTGYFLALTFNPAMLNMKE
ncbi:MAG: hypothetical protein J0M10_10215 [Chitinophagales bacterium]|nr:hypothetical protein [Chitinophagales bacterium]